MPPMLVERLRAVMRDRDELIDAFDAFVRTADDRDVVRINAVLLAARLGQRLPDVVALLLHARKLGLATMEWQYVCPGCGEVVERLTSLTSATAHYCCQVCSTDREADLSDLIEVTFSISPEVRRSRFHDPWSLSPEEYFLAFRFSQSAVVDDGTPLSDHLRKHARAAAFVEPGATDTFLIDAEPGYLWLTNGPALTVGQGRTDDVRRFAFEYTGVRSKGYRADIAAGPVEIAFTNATESRYPLLITMLPDHYDVRMQPILSGADGLTVSRLALVFTDLKGSTALYERVGDLKAFDLIRRHFGYLREVIARNQGALVKAIGDAVMASFVDTIDALRAALEMRARIAPFNAESGDAALALKVGLHSGACLAVTLNDRLDYFGQTVNIAARVQGLAAGGEIAVTDDILAVPGAADLVAGLDDIVAATELRGVAGEIRVHRLGG